MRTRKRIRKHFQRARTPLPRRNHALCTRIDPARRHSLRFAPLVSTRRACLDPAGNARETAYFQALESATRHSLDGGELVLYRGNQVVARFQSAGK